MKLFDLKGKVALVTGGNGGIGLGIARGLAAAGASVAIVGRNRKKTAAAAGYLADFFQTGALSLVADISKADQTEKLIHDVVDRFGRLDIVFHNAGISIRRPPQDLTLEQWHEVMDVNLTSAFLVSKAAYPELKRQGGGKIINIGSMTSIFGAGFAPAYAASKGAIHAMTLSAAARYAPDRIRFNLIAPALIATPMAVRAAGDSEILAYLSTKQPMAGGPGTAADCAEAALFLCEPASRFVTGTVLSVDGGWCVSEGQYPRPERPGHAPQPQAE